ncbi:MAG: cytochrome c-type biogenesis protein [Alphaproteobacteria bacterium]
MKQASAFLILTMLVVLTTGPTALAVEPDEVLADPALEARARAISTELRCVVCQNQSIDDSDSEIARDMRILVRERLVAGDNDEEVVNYLVARYGDFVLLRPPFQPNTLALWLAPPIMAVVIATLSVMFYQAYRRRRPAGNSPDPLSPADRAELDALVERIASTSPPRSWFRDEIHEGLTPHPEQDDEPPAADESGDADTPAGNADTQQQT